MGFRLHTLVAVILFAQWPFTRLVHVFRAPVGYLTRPYIVYRSRDEDAMAGTGNRPPRLRLGTVQEAEMSNTESTRPSTWG